MIRRLGLCRGRDSHDLQRLGVIDDAARSRVDARHAFIAVDAVAAGHGAVCHFVDELRVAQESTTDRDVLEAFFHGALDRLYSVHAA